MAASSGEQIVVEVETVDQLFNAPPADPFAGGESAVLGQAGIERVLTRLQARPLRSWEGARLVVRLPGDQITPDLEAALGAALYRYCTARIEDNRLRVRLTRKQRTRGLMVVTAIALTVIAATPVLFATLLAGASETVQAVATSAISLFCWIIVWDPLRALLFDWTPQARENGALGHLKDMRVTVEKVGERADRPAAA
jgi:hypothetical protein